MHGRASLRRRKALVLPGKLRLLKQDLICKIRAPAGQFRDRILRLDLDRFLIRILIGKVLCDLLHPRIFLIRELIGRNPLSCLTKSLHQILCRMTAGLLRRCSRHDLRRLHTDFLACLLQRRIYHVQEGAASRLLFVQTLQILHRSYDFQPVDGTCQSYI